jgi:hypothetical protein
MIDFEPKFITFDCYGIHKAHVLRGHEPEAPEYGYTPIKSIVELAEHLGS